MHGPLRATALDAGAQKKDLPPAKADLASASSKTCTFAPIPIDMPCKSHRRCLDSLFQQPDLDFFHLAVSLDHAPAFDKMEALMEGWHEDVKEILSCFGLCKRLYMINILFSNASHDFPVVETPFRCFKHWWAAEDFLKICSGGGMSRPKVPKNHLHPATPISTDLD